MNRAGHPVLLVDDDVDLCALLARWLGLEGYEVATIGDAESLVAALAQQLPSAVCLDVHLPGASGLEALRRLRRTHPNLPVLLLTGERDTETAIEAMKLGAYDYLLKPIGRARLLAEVAKAIEHGSMAVRLAQLEREARGEGFGGMIGESAAMRAMFRNLDRVAPSDVSVLIHGESGSGKELVARAIHQQSGRSGGSFVALNCAAIAETLQESELFGHERGAFTGADKQRVGALEEADGGTLFLDEIAEMDLGLQAKLLRVLQERSFRRVGGSRDVSSDFRLIAASHRDLRALVAEDAFREDLYFRIAVFELGVPPLRERGNDILRLAVAILDEVDGRGDRPPKSLSPGAAEVLLAYSWPGNVRELENVLKHAAVVSSHAEIGPADLPARTREGSGDPGPERDDRLVSSEQIMTLAEAERQAIDRALRASDGSISKAARMLEIARATLYRKINRYEID